jgi:uncharacterized membrane protein YdjX (TVP38/TMEM64 family)
MQTLFSSRKFWAALIGLVLIAATAFLPTLPDINAPLVELASLVSAYILGTALEANPKPAREILAGLVKSRKFWATLAGLLVVIIRTFRPDFPLGDDQIVAIVLTLSAYTFGTGLQDSLIQTREAIHAETKA